MFVLCVWIHQTYFLCVRYVTFYVETKCYVAYLLMKTKLLEVEETLNLYFFVFVLVVIHLAGLFFVTHFIYSLFDGKISWYDKNIGWFGTVMNMMFDYLRNVTPYYLSYTDFKICIRLHLICENRLIQIMLYIK